VFAKWIVDHYQKNPTYNFYAATAALVSELRKIDDSTLASGHLAHADKATTLGLDSANQLSAVDTDQTSRGSME
jgi:hypothetical protein